MSWYKTASENLVRDLQNVFQTLEQQQRKVFARQTDLELIIEITEPCYVDSDQDEEMQEEQRERMEREQEEELERNKEELDKLEDETFDLMEQMEEIEELLNKYPDLEDEREFEIFYEEANRVWLKYHQLPTFSDPKQPSILSYFKPDCKL